jgi:hypothetical protein
MMQSSARRALYRTPSQWAPREAKRAVQHLREASYWHEQVAEYGLHVSEGRVEAGDAGSWLSPLDETDLARARSDLAERGYLQWTSLVDPRKCEALKQAVTALCRGGWDASFINLVDEVWQLIVHLARVLTRVLGPSMSFRREVFAFCVDPSLVAARSRGVPAHRDRRDCGYERWEGLPISRHCTCWVSLTDADEANGCMYIVPAAAGDETSLAVPAVESEQGRAVRTQPGDVLAWTGQVLHWGGRFDPARARGPRASIALSLTHSCIGSMAALAPIDVDNMPSFADRLDVVCGMLASLNPPPAGSDMQAVLGVMRGRR